MGVQISSEEVVVNEQLLHECKERERGRKTGMKSVNKL